MIDIHGRINGEYGFITADNVYHVTVYATDENGNFKIISMKNIKLHQLPELPPRSAIPTTTIQSFTVRQSNAFDSVTTQKSELCASCHLPPKPDTETIKPTNNNNNNAADGEDSSTIPPPFKIVSKNDSPVNQNVENSLSLNSNGQQQSTMTTTSNNLNQQQQQNMNSLEVLNSRQPTMSEKLNSFELSNNNNKFNLGGQQQQLSNANGLLYRYDYATDFQGHKEEGDQLGNKNGEYFSIGRDNIKRIVSYNANEFGFMPHIRQQPINQHYDERNNQLRHYNFEWFYPNSVVYG